MSDKQHKLLWLEVMRGLAALWVLLHHGELAISHFVGPLNASPLLTNGFVGVDFFFVLSGYIIALSSFKLATAGGGLRDYLQARLVRILVPYLPIGAGMYLLYALLPGLSEGGRHPSLLTSLTLLPDAAPPALSVAWTLVHEMVFYAIFAIWFLNRRLFWVAMLVWMAAILWVWHQGIEPALPWSYLLSPRNLCFALGLGLCLLTSVLTVPLQAAGVALLAGLLVVGLQAAQSDPSHFWLAIGFGLLVLAASSPLAMRLAPGAGLVTLGTASYAVYLVHNPVQSLAVRVLKKVWPAATPVTAMVLVCAIALAAGLVYWRAYERPALRTVRRLLPGMRSARPTSAG